MSRRKQKFPSHITGEGDGANCQEDYEQISSVVDGRETDEQLTIDASPLPEAGRHHNATMEDSQSNDHGRSSPYSPTPPADVKAPNFYVNSYSPCNSNRESAIKDTGSQPPGKSPIVKVVGSHPTLISYGTTYLQQPCHGALSPKEYLDASTGAKSEQDSLSETETETKYGSISYCSVPSAINSANIFSANKIVYSLSDATAHVDTTLRESAAGDHGDHRNPPAHESRHSRSESCRRSLSCEVSSSSSEDNHLLLGTADEGKSSCRSLEVSFKCPVCDENFKSKRSFNSHILIHCQLIKSPTISGSKRTVEESLNGTVEKKRLNENAFSEQIDPSCTSCLPLDLSYKRQEKYMESVRVMGLQTPSKCHSVPSSPQSTPASKGVDLNCSILSDRSPLEDENENLVNEAREHEKAFFDHSQNELFLTEDSTMLEPPPPLPMFHSGGVIRRVRVGSDDGPPMVYRVKIYAEQIFASRILGMNEETGDKIELYKCFMCSLSFPSVSRLQAHLTHHKQRFVCCKCNYSCDSRLQFSHHVQKKHLTKEFSRTETRRTHHGDSSEDSSNAENTVTVAALLSALHGSSIDRKKFQCQDGEERRALSMVNEEQRYLDDSLPASPESQMEVGGKNSDPSSPGGDLFKMFSCRFCGKKFDRAFSCNRHERVHTGFKPCFCRICGRGFSEPRNLRHHVIRFHSDGSLRHLIKRDRRKRKDEESNTPSASPTPSKDMLRESDNMEPAGAFVAGALVGMYSPPNNGLHNGGSRTHSEFFENSMFIKTDSHLNSYTNNLTEMFAATLESSNRINKSEKISPDDLHDTESQPMHVNFSNGSLLHLCEDSMDQLEPGEIRLNLRTKIIDDGERGRRLIIAEDQSEDGLDHSPQFSAYAPRLDIVQEPVKRDKALTPITDDIGRTFYECPYCQKYFGSTSDLNRHLDFHEDLRPYDCKYCEYSARTNSQLKVHKMRHEGIKQFSCDVCNYNGVTQSDLNRHKKTQSHIARYQNVCPVCGLGFYSSAQKKVHIVKCHPEMEGASSLIQMSLGFPATSGDSPPPGIVGSDSAPSVNGLSRGAQYDISPHSDFVSPSLNTAETLVSSPQKPGANLVTPSPNTAATSSSQLTVSTTSSGIKSETPQSLSSFFLTNHSNTSSLFVSSGSSSNMVSSNI